MDTKTLRELHQLVRELELPTNKERLLNHFIASGISLIESDNLIDKKEIREKFSPTDIQMLEHYEHEAPLPVAKCVNTILQIIRSDPL